MTNKRVAIIGGAGKMGRWLASFLHSAGCDVILTDTDEENLRETGRRLGLPFCLSSEIAVTGADYIILAVPMTAIEPVVRYIGPYVKGWQSVIDITSIKVSPVKAMHKHITNGLVLGGHPLFGPGAASLENKNIVLTPTNDEEIALANTLKSFLEGMGGRVSLMSPDEHDELMSIVLGLSHFIALVTADTLLEARESRQMEAAGSSTYKVLMTLVESVLSEDPDLYAAIQMNLPKAKNFERLFQRKTAIWLRLVTNRRRKTFAKRMTKLQEKLAEVAPDFQKSYEKMYRIVEGL